MKLFIHACIQISNQKRKKVDVPHPKVRIIILELVDCDENGYLIHLTLIQIQISGFRSSLTW